MIGATNIFSIICNLSPPLTPPPTHCTQCTPCTYVQFDLGLVRGSVSHGHPLYFSHSPPPQLESRGVFSLTCIAHSTSKVIIGLWERLYRLQPRHDVAKNPYPPCCQRDSKIFKIRNFPDPGSSSMKYGTPVTYSYRELCSMVPWYSMVPWHGTLVLAPGSYG
eukprot:SAG11_NODE_2138_length_3763_cov_2.690229_7_plen_163_part_00